MTRTRPSRGAFWHTSRVPANETDDESRLWTSPWWLVICVSVVMGLVAGVVAVVTAGSSEAEPTGWLAFWIAFAAVGGGNVAVSAVHRRKC